MTARVALLHDLLRSASASSPESPAVIQPDVGAITWEALDNLSNRVRDRLHWMGVRDGDRVGLCVHKSIDGIAAVYGILKLGAAYVPVDPDAPAARCALIFADCAVRAIVAERELANRLDPELDALNATPEMLLLDGTGGGASLATALEREHDSAPAPEAETVRASPDSLAYILYTSGSTGRPKGVMLTHRAALAFVNWCSATFAPAAEDRFSSHAPLHFDLSIFDLYVAAASSAPVVLIDEELGKDPLRLAEVVARERITVWYSTPSILSLLAQYGKLERHDYGALRLVLFAGEVFPIPRLREVVARWPRPRFFNLYGPTETNVCTYHEVVTPVPPERVDPYPIGRTCEHLRSRVVDPDGNDVPISTEGELVVAGIGIMSGYWNLSDRSGDSFLQDDDGERWYRTGDLVVLGQDGVHDFHGRRDRMVKRRGYRIELGEIEAGLATHPCVREVAVYAEQPTGGDVRITAVISVSGEQRPSLIDMKQFCADRLPRYMSPDRFRFVDSMPRTSTDKIDYQSLAAPSPVGITS